MSLTNNNEVNMSSSSNSEEDEQSSSNITECKRRDQRKTRSVSFAPTVKEYEIPSRYDPSYVSPCPPPDYLDALVESYKLQTLTTLYPFHYEEKKRYIPKTTYTRLNPNWREHRIRHLMNRLEELSLWDREEELKISQAQFLREQKLEQIQDRQRNHNLCLHLMRQRHESEIESAVLLDRALSSVNDESTAQTIAQAVQTTSPYTLRQRLRREQEKMPIYKTPVGRFRQFQSNMNNKLDMINRTSKLDRDTKRSLHRSSSMPPTVVPLFSETYALLLSVPERYSSNRSNRYQSTPSLSPTEHASSPDYERLIRSHSNRDVRVPFKEEDVNDNDKENVDHNSSSSKRFTNSLRDFSLIHSRQPTSTSIHQRTLNDDLNAITQLPLANNKTILRNLTNLSNVLSTRYRSSSVPRDNDMNDNLNSYSTSRIAYQPKMVPLLLAR